MSQIYIVQPQATPGMTFGGGGNRNVKNLPMHADGRDWSNNLFDCCDDPGTCFCAWCCPCVVYAQNKQRYEHLHSKGLPDPEHGGGCCSCDCTLHALISTFCFGAGWILQMTQRANVRSRYNIKGGGGDDCCTTFFCSPCELTQEAQELELEENSFGGHFHAQK